MTSIGPRDSTTFELRDALAQPGCPICALVLRSVGRFIESVAYERVNDIALRANLRGARGFCNVHAHRWLREAHNVLGTALIYRDVMRAAIDEISVDVDRTRGGLLARWRGRSSLSPRRIDCPACVEQRDAEDRFLSALAAILAEPADVALFEASDGVCLTHALAALRRGDREAELVVRHTVRRAQGLLTTLDEVIRKEDYRFRDEPRTDEERTAPADAVAWTKAAEGLTG